MNLTFRIFTILFVLQACSEKKEGDSSFSDGALNRTLLERGLSEADLIGAVKTYQASGVHDEYLGYYGTGSSGRVAVVALPSMKILKFVGVFSNEPWQGFGFDNESRRILRESGRDEIQYHFGDSLVPALSQTAGAHDSRALFLADGAHARIGLMDLSEYETRQIVTHPYFMSSHPSLAVDPDTRYVMQVTANPQFPKIPQSTLSKQRWSAATFWRYEEDQGKPYLHPTLLLNPKNSFTVLLPAGLSADPVMGKGATVGKAYVVSHCFQGQLYSQRCSSEDESVLYAIDWKSIEAKSPRPRPRPDDMGYWTFDEAKKSGAITAWKLPLGTERAIISPKGDKLLLTQRSGKDIVVINLKDLQGGSDLLNPAVKSLRVNLGGPSPDAAFFGEETIYASVLNPGRIVKVDLNQEKIVDQLELGFDPGRIMLPLSDVVSDVPASYLTVANSQPHGRYSATGPNLGWNMLLIDLSSDKMRVLYNQSMSQTNALGGVAMLAKMNETITKYKIGTDPRAGIESPFKTMPGQERVVKEGNRVHMFGTVIRSRITPDYFEVQQGDTVTVSLTNIEQAHDQTHGFTIGTYNVHGSLEPGKTATFTFEADRSGVFPMYCTEFCSALHLEMQGYFLVKPSPVKAMEQALYKKYLKKDTRDFFKFIKGELR